LRQKEDLEEERYWGKKGRGKKKESASSLLLCQEKKKEKNIDSSSVLRKRKSRENTLPAGKRGGERREGALFPSISKKEKEGETGTTTPPNPRGEKIRACPGK